MASATSSGSQPSRSASSLTVGARPCSPAAASVARRSAATRSCIARGTCADQAVSRIERLISPRIVGTANEVKAKPRSGSNRSIALTRPSEPTCSRSSSGSLARA